MGADMALLEHSMLKQMDLVTMQLPVELPQVPASEIDHLVASNCPAKFSQSPLSVDPQKVLDSIKDTIVQVAVTPLGNADAPLGDMFVQPYITEMTVAQLLGKLEKQDNSTKVYYMQSQDDNLNKELRHCAIPRDLPSIKRECPLLARAGPPEAANLWIGGPRTRSRLHNDNYDNIFVQLHGQKRIYLIPPSHVYGVHERFLVPKRYTFEGELVDDEDDMPRVLFPTVDPSDPPLNDAAYSAAKVYSVTLQAGDALFIPALWYHQVEIISDELNMSANYWYAPNPVNALWPMWDYLRSSSLVLRGEHDDVYFS